MWLWVWPRGCAWWDTTDGNRDLNCVCKAGMALLHFLHHPFSVQADEQDLRVWVWARAGVTPGAGITTASTSPRGVAQLNWIPAYSLMSLSLHEYLLYTHVNDGAIGIGGGGKGSTVTKPKICFGAGWVKGPFQRTRKWFSVSGGGKKNGQNSQCC